MSIEEINIEQLKFPIGKPNIPLDIPDEQTEKWIRTIESFPFDVFQLTKELNEAQLSWAYRPDGWSIRQLVHHCADSHLNAFIRFKWALTEDDPTVKVYFEDRWARLADSSELHISSAQSLLDGLHERWTHLLRSLTPEQLDRHFIHPETGKKIQLRKNIGLYEWHCRHHLAHIQLALEFEGRFKQTD